MSMHDPLQTVSRPHHTSPTTFLQCHITICVIDFPLKKSSAENFWRCFSAKVRQRPNGLVLVAHHGSTMAFSSSTHLRESNGVPHITWQRLLRIRVRPKIMLQNPQIQVKSIRLNILPKSPDSLGTSYFSLLCIIHSCLMSYLTQIW